MFHDWLVLLHDAGVLVLLLGIDYGGRLRVAEDVNELVRSDLVVLGSFIERTHSI